MLAQYRGYVTARASQVEGAKMVQAFSCYLHKPGVTTPELRIVSCNNLLELPAIVFEELRTWGVLRRIDVYDASDQAVYSLTLPGPPEDLSSENAHETG